MKKRLIALIATFVASALSAQSFVAGWDFDGVTNTDTTATANWGSQAGSATLAWSHSVASGPPSFTAREFGVSLAFNSASIGNSFQAIDTATGYDEFSDNQGSLAEGGFESLSTDTFTISFDASSLTNLTLRYALDSDGADTGAGFSLVDVDLSSLDGNSNAQWQIITIDGALYDNFQVIGVVPEPSTYAAIIGMIAFAFVAIRRRK